MTVGGNGIKLIPAIPTEGRRAPPSARPATEVGHDFSGTSQPLDRLAEVAGKSATTSGELLAMLGSY